MSLLFNKQTRLHRSISAKVNPEQDKNKLLKPHQEYINLQREFNLKAKGIQGPMTQQLLNAKVQENRQSFKKSIISDSYQKQGSLSARQQLRSKLHPCNPFESLTQSSIKRNPENQKAMELILAHRKINELQNCLQILTKELNLTKQQKFQLQKENNHHLSTLKSQVSELTQQNYVLVTKCNEITADVEKLMLENKNLLLQIDNLKFLNNHLSQDHQKKTYHNSQKSSQKFRQLGQDFERKIKDLYDQNYKLKNKVSWFQGKLEEAETLVLSLKSLNEILQKRFQQEEKEGESIKERLEKENEMLRQQNLLLRQEKEQMKSEHQTQVLRLQNQICELREQVKKALKDQNSNYSIQQTSKKLLRLKAGEMSSYRRISRQERMIEQLQMGLKQQIEEVLRLKEKNKRLTKMLK